MTIRRKYDSGQNRHKHHWNKAEAGFISDGVAKIGKCPNTINPDLAQKLSMVLRKLEEKARKQGHQDNMKKWMR